MYQRTGDAPQKVLVIGEAGTGKTSLIRRFVDDVFVTPSPSHNNPRNSHERVTAGLDFTEKVVEHPRPTQQQQQDAAHDAAPVGHCGSRTVRSADFFRNAVGAIVVADVPRLDSTLEIAAQWKRELDAKVLHLSHLSIPCLLLLNKCDLGPLGLGPLQLPQAEMDAYAVKHGFCGWFETSAKENTRVAQAFGALLEHMQSAASGASAKKMDLLARRQFQDREKRLGCFCN